MAQKTIKGSATIAKQIKARRNELGLTIEEAASRAGVGTKTWSRYEAGESIRKDKCKGICKALSWRTFPNLEEEEEEVSMQEYKEYEAWSEFLEDAFGEKAAMAFATGSDILLDYIGEDMTELASLPVKSHLGQLNTSWLCSDLPEQFLMHYDYDFLYQLKCTLYKLRAQAKNNVPMEAHNVMEELVFYLCNQTATTLIELSGSDDDVYAEDWVFDLLGDMDIISCLYSNIYLDANHPYHFCHWNDQQFYTEANP